MKISYFEEMCQKIRNEFIILYAMKNINEMSVSDISNKVHISRTTFYNYYDDLYEVLEDIEDRLIVKLKFINSSFEKDNLKKYKNVVFDYFYDTLEFIKENNIIFKTLMTKDSQFIYKWKKIIKEDFKRKYDREKIRLNNQELVLEMISSAVIGAYLYWMLHIDDISIEDMANEVLYKLCQDFF